MQDKKECPLCEVSEETIERLKEKPQSPKKKSSLGLKVIVSLLILGLAIFIFYQFFSGSAQEDIFFEGLGVGDLAPDFVSEDIYGNRIALSDFQNEKPVLLVFWATWCGYCAKELPDLKDFAQEYQDEIQTLVVPSGEIKETIKEYIAEKDINFLIVLDETREIWSSYLVRGTPSHFLIDSQREIVTLRPGLASREDLEIMTTMLTEFW